MEPSQALPNESQPPEILLLFMKELARRAWKATLARFIHVDRSCYFLGMPELYRRIDMQESNFTDETFTGFVRDQLNIGKHAHVADLIVKWL